MIRQMTMSLVTGLLAIAAVAQGASVDAPDIILVKVNMNNVGLQETAGAVLIPFNDAQVTHDAEGDVNPAQILSLCAERMPGAEPIALLLAPVDEEALPPPVRALFDQVDGQDHFLRTAWHWWHPVDGKTGRAFFGYGFSPYWGVDLNTAPYYGFYDGSAIVPYIYGFSRTLGGASSFYYWR